MSAVSDAEHRLDLARRLGPVERGPEVVVLDLVPVEEGHTVGPLELRFAVLGQGEEERQVAVAGRRPVTRLEQPVAGELADRLEQPVAGVVGAMVDLDQRLVDEAGRARRAPS